MRLSPSWLMLVTSLVLKPLAVGPEWEDSYKSY